MVVIVTPPTTVTTVVVLLGVVVVACGVEEWDVVRLELFEPDVTFQDKAARLVVLAEVSATIAAP